MKHLYRELQHIIPFICVLIILGTPTGNGQAPDTLQVHFSVQQCDSLIQANAQNPGFVILDVRTAGEYYPQHLEGAINKDYYASNFSQTINALPKHKIYVIHCLGGGRSLQTFNLMKSSGFPLIVNMLGGISAWNSASLPTTSSFAPLLMGVSDSLVTLDTIAIGHVDSIRCTITNRANDTLRFTGISDLTGSEFSTDFDTTCYLLGASDYTFSIFYEPVDALWDSLAFMIQSNGGMIDFHVTGTGISTAGWLIGHASSTMRVYPNPSSGNVTIDFGTDLKSGMLLVFNSGAQVILSQSIENSSFTTLEVPGPPGVYFLELVSTEGSVLTSKILKP